MISFLHNKKKQGSNNQINSIQFIITIIYLNRKYKIIQIIDYTIKRYHYFNYINTIHSSIQLYSIHIIYIISLEMKLHTNMIYHPFFHFNSFIIFYLSWIHYPIIHTSCKWKIIFSYLLRLYLVWMNWLIKNSIPESICQIVDNMIITSKPCRIELILNI